ncbi:tRNA threonylcarbamoyladenosine dehydratase [Hydrogenophaga soli]
MDVDRERRFGGLRRLWGDAGAQACAAAHVVVVGIGGVGSWAAEALARSGVGALTLIDLDNVAESNINRQIHATADTLGMAKVQAMAERISSYHPGCRVHGVEDFLTAENIHTLLADVQRVAGPVDAVLDACDQVKAKVAMAAWARQSKVEHVTVGAAGGKLHAQQVEVDDLSAVSHDPLLARMRQNLRKFHGYPVQGKPMKVRSVFSRETVRPPVAACLPAGEADGSLNCHGYGSMVTVTATFGMTAAGVVLNALAGMNP